LETNLNRLLAARTCRGSLGPSPIEILGDVARVGLVNRNREIVGWTVVDVADAPLVRHLRWRCGNGYALTSAKGFELLMQRILMLPPDDMTVDHIDGDKLNNRRSNLRICTQSENSRFMWERRRSAKVA
jgi:hypothetical protein